MIDVFLLLYPVVIDDTVNIAQMDVKDSFLQYLVVVDDIVYVAEVHVEVAPLSRAVGAQVALVGPLAGVGADVPQQCRVAVAAPAAVRANVARLAGNVCWVIRARGVQTPA